MHIVFISGEYPLWVSGGVGTFIQTLGHALVALGHKVTVVGVGVSNKEIQIEDMGVTVYRLPKNISKIPNFWVNYKRINRKLLQLHKENSIAIIETAEGGMAFLSKKHPAKKVIRLHGGHHFFSEAEKRGINWRKGMLEKISFAKTDGFIAVSKYVKEHTQSYLSYHNKPIRVIPSSLTARDIPKLSVNQNAILFAGTVCEKKGVRQLLAAFKIVRERFPNKELHLYGRLNWVFPDGTLYIDYLKSILDVTYFEKVFFHGSIPREELLLKYAEAACCVFPSHMETQGLVCLEAMLMERPVVFSKYGPGPETIEDGATGLLCDVYNPKDIAEKILWIFEHQKEASTMGKTARQKVINTYDVEKVVQTNVSFYKSLIDGSF